jgi:hypothetical protein
MKTFEAHAPHRSSLNAALLGARLFNVATQSINLGSKQR